MCPVSEIYTDEQIIADITDICQKKGNEKVLSGIDRFNRRYNRQVFPIFFY